MSDLLTLPHLFLALLSISTLLRLSYWGFVILPYVIRYPSDPLKQLPENKGEKSGFDESAKKNVAESRGVSVIICAKNEEKSLSNNLAQFLEQDHKRYEVIVVDDQSEDGTADVLREYEKKYGHLRVVSMGSHLKTYPGKKLALLLAIKRSAYDCLLLTDADCRPAGKNWLKLMASGLAGDKKIVLGYAPFEPGIGFDQFETLYTGVQFLAMAHAGIPYMGVGRNMGYRKSFFLEKKGFSGNLALASGDDDLFVAKHATWENTSLVVHPEAFTYSPPSTGFADWFARKRRHLNAGRYYPPRIRAILGAIWIIKFLFYISAVSVIVMPGFRVVGLSVLGGMVLLQLALYAKPYKVADSIKSWILHPVYDFIYHCIYYPFMGLVLYLFKQSPVKW